MVEASADHTGSAAPHPPSLWSRGVGEGGCTDGVVGPHISTPPLKGRGRGVAAHILTLGELVIQHIKYTLVTILPASPSIEEIGSLYPASDHGGNRPWKPCTKAEVYFNDVY